CLIHEKDLKQVRWPQPCLICHTQYIPIASPEVSSLLVGFFCHIYNDNKGCPKPLMKYSPSQLLLAESQKLGYYKYHKHNRYRKAQTHHKLSLALLYLLCL